MSTSKDQLYSQPQSFTHRFRFDARVAEVFEDMLSRSVPGYQQILELLPTLVRQFRKNHCHYYDLGCSLGAGMLSIAQGMDDVQGTIIGVDNSPDMLKQAQQHLDRFPHVEFELRCQNLTECEFKSAAMILMNFTLQFIDPKHRSDLIGEVYSGLIKGGALVLSEKIVFEDTETNTTLTGLHHQYKADQGYSKLEIAQKRDAIENVLIPETLDTHITRLRKAGFSVITPWIQNLQFISILAIK